MARSDAVRQFDPEPRGTKESDRIDLLLTTDLLSEGVNLQNAGVVVHLDVPWTAARLEQRVGRVARAGSPHKSVAVFGLRPPASADRALRASAIVQSKWSSAASAIGADDDPCLADQNCPNGALPGIHETLRDVLTDWITPLSDSTDVPLVAAVEADSEGFLAVLENESRCFLLCDLNRGSLDPSDVCDVAARASGDDAPFDCERIRNALARINRWVTDELSKEFAGLSDARFLQARRKVFARINSFVAAGAPHSRFERERIARNMRGVAGSTLGAEDERVLDELGRAADPFSRDDWLVSDSARRNPNLVRPGGTGDYTIRALLLLVSTPQRAS
jgi:hypothetical protein